jgi:hypothetical protein
MGHPSLRARLRHAEAYAAQQAQQAARANYLVVALLTQIGDAILTPDTTKAVDLAIRTNQGKLAWSYEPNEGGGGKLTLKDVTNGKTDE